LGKETPRWKQGGVFIWVRRGRYDHPFEIFGAVAKKYPHYCNAISQAGPFPAFHIRTHII